MTRRRETPDRRRIYCLGEELSINPIGRSLFPLREDRAGMIVGEGQRFRVLFSNNRLHCEKLRMQKPPSKDTKNGILSHRPHGTDNANERAPKIPDPSLPCHLLQKTL